MPKSTRVVFIALLFLSIITTALVFKHSKDVAERSILNSYIDSAINDYKEEREPFIDFATINYFSWDKIYIFGSYSDCRDIIKALDDPYFWFECKASGIEDYEGILLFVFKRKSFIAKSTTYSGASINRNSQVGYSHNNASFIFNEEGRMIWVGDQ